MRGADLGRDVVVLACAVSAGIHGALVPEHLAEDMGAGLGFVAATAALGAAAAAVSLRPRPGTLAGAAVVLAGLLVAYALAATVGVPPLHPEPAGVDALGLATKAVEAAGLLAAVAAARPAAVAHLPPKGT